MTLLPAKLIDKMPDFSGGWLLKLPRLSAQYIRHFRKACWRTTHRDALPLTHNDVFLPKPTAFTPDCSSTSHLFTKHVMFSRHARNRGCELVLERLQQLIAANDLETFATAARFMHPPLPTQLTDYTTPSVAATVTRAWANGLRLLLRDVRGSVLDAPSDTFNAIDSLTVVLYNWSEILAVRAGLGRLAPSESISSTSATDGAELAYRVHFAEQMAKTGALQMMASFCSAVAADLLCRSKHQHQHQQQQHQQQEPVLLRRGTARLIGNSLLLWCCLYRWWPGKILEGSHGLAVTVKPVVALPTAVLTTSATAQAADCDASSLASSSAGDNSRQIDTTPATQAITLGVALLDVIGAQGCTSLEPSSALPLVLELAAAGDTLLLAAAVIGSFTRFLWEQQQQQGKQNYLPEAYHVQLMQKLGCSKLAINMQVFPDLACPERARDLLISFIRTTVRVVLCAVDFFGRAQRQMQSASANSSISDAVVAAAAMNEGSSPAYKAGTTPSNEQEDNSSRSNSSSTTDHQVLPAIELAMVLLELLSLLSPTSQQVSNARGAVHALAMYSGIYTLYGSTASAPRSARYPHCSFTQILQPLLFCMGPAVAKVLQTSRQQDQQQSNVSSTTASESSVTAAATDTLSAVSPGQHMLEEFGAFLLTVTACGAGACEADSQGLAAAILNKPQECISSLCFGMRTTAAAVFAGKQPTQRDDIQPLYQFAHIIAAAVKAVVVRGSKELCADHTGIDVMLPQNEFDAQLAASPQLQQQLFSLLLCCSKVTAQRQPDEMKAEVHETASAVAAVAARIGCIIIQLPAAQPASSTSSDKADRVAAVQPWLVLVARSLNISLLNVQGPEQASTPTDENVLQANLSRALAVGPAWQYILQALRQTIVLLQSQQQLLAAAEATPQPVAGKFRPASRMALVADGQVLLQQQGVLKSALVIALEKVQGLCRIATNNNTPTTSNAEVLAEGELLLSQLGQQLQEAGAAVCAALPVPYCCNNPGCCSFRGESEQQLVSGKVCVCGGCHVARYCGTECQTAHWQQHKAVCKRIKKERLAGS